MKAAISRLRQLIRRFFAAMRAQTRCRGLHEKDQEVLRCFGLDDMDQEVLRCKIRAAPTMQERSRGHWRLPYLYEFTLDQAHTFLRERLEQKLNRPEKELRAKLKLEFNTWQDYSDDIFKICKTLDDLLFGGNLGNNVGYARVSRAGVLGFTKYHGQSAPVQPAGYFYIVVTLHRNLLSELQDARVPTYKLNAELWGTLIHEMLHAYIMIATGGNKTEERCKCGLLTSHGPKWNATIAALAARLDLDIEPRDMTNRTEICHEPDYHTDIKAYKGVFRSNGRRYSHHDYSRPNTFSKEAIKQWQQRMAAKQKQKAVDPEPKATLRQRRGTFPGRTRKDYDGISHQDYTSQTLLAQYRPELKWP